MGHHIDPENRFQSDKYDIPPDQVLVSFKDPAARRALEELAAAYESVDLEFAQDVQTRLFSVLAEDTHPARQALDIWTALPGKATPNEGFLDGWNTGVAHVLKFLEADLELLARVAKNKLTYKG